MDTAKIIASLEQQSKFKYYKFITDKGPNSCAKCLAHEGKYYREDESPGLPIHPNCKCRLLAITDSTGLALAKYSPKIIYRHDTKNDKDIDFNQKRADLEKNYGTIIDHGKFSAPGYEMAPDINKNGVIRGLYRHISFREGKHASGYLDGKQLPTIGIGANMTQEHILKKMLSMRAITEAQAEELRKIGKLSQEQREKRKKEIEAFIQKINLSEEQIYELYKITLTVAVKDVVGVINKGTWVSRVGKDGKPEMGWDPNKIDGTAWGKLPPLVQAICIDLSFNTGAGKLKDYASFLKAIKMGDYRRAAIELINSKDYTDNVKPGAKNHGLAKRRLDAAIELNKLADELESKRKAEQ
ncbi:MAG: hypothetical protein HPZ91_08315 [Lentisphaeria bacterium]|nr:hypothetical protein [Lentisphaeria bacterium]